VINHLVDWRRAQSAGHRGKIKNIIERESGRGLFFLQ
jgi:hypothetical protein